MYNLIVQKREELDSMLFQKSNFSIVTLMVILVSCTSHTTEKSQVSSVETTQENPASTLVPNQSPTNEPTSTPNLNSVNTPDVNQLNPGIYLLYMRPDESIVRVYATQLGVSGQLFLFTANGYFDVSSNGKFLAYTNDETNTLDILSVESNDILKLPLPTDAGCADISVSADGAMIACGGTEIFIVSTAENEWRKLTYWSERKPEDTWDNPRYSPNGKWLSYFNLADMPFSKSDGLYLTDITCLSRIESCWENTVGPVFNEIAGLPGNGNSFSWSPDSQKIVMPDYNKLYLFDVKTGTSKVLSVDIYPTSVSWSPTGDVIAFSDYNVYLISSNGNDLERVINDAWLLGWLVIPWKFEEGDSYAVTAKGSNLNLRETPSLDGKIIDTLLGGDVLTILEGSILSDGYSWRKVKTNQDLVGWIVDIPDWFQPIP